MKLKYLIPFIGFYFVNNDIPHEESERHYKPLQGDEALFVMCASLISTFSGILLLGIILTK